MGKEFEGIARIDGVASSAKLHLDGAALQIRGASRLSVPLSHMRNVNVTSDALRLDSPYGLIELELGAKRAHAWATAITSPKALIDKLDLHDGDRVCIENIADAAFHRDVKRASGSAPAMVLQGTFDVIFVGVRVPDELELIEQATRHLEPRGALWIVSPKGKGTPVPETLVRRRIVAAGLYDAKVAAFSSELTAIKAMYRKADRGESPGARRA